MFLLEFASASVLVRVCLKVALCKCCAPVCCASCSVQAALRSLLRASCSVQVLHASCFVRFLCASALCNLLAQVALWKCPLNFRKVTYLKSAAQGLHQSCSAHMFYETCLVQIAQCLDVCAYRITARQLLQAHPREQTR